jgi:hypothetical protein
MKTIAFSIRGLLAAVTLIAVGLFALLNASPLWDSIIVSLTLLLLLTALLSLACRPGPRRAFWIGFAIFGWGYLILVDGPIVARDLTVRSNLPTNVVLDMLHMGLARVIDPSSVDRMPPNVRAQRSPSRQNIVRLPNRPSFRHIGHCLWAWLLAVIGGFMARHFYLAQERKPS